MILIFIGWIWLFVTFLIWNGVLNPDHITLSLAIALVNANIFLAGGVVIRAMKGDPK